MKKKIFALLLCLIFALTFCAGCGSSDQESAEPEAETETEATADVGQRTVYVTPEWVKGVIDGNQEGYENYVICEVSYGDVDSSPDYAEGHLPGAIHVGIVEVEDATGDASGAYNLLAADEVVKNLLSHGITKDTKVILYGQDPCGVGRQAYGYIWAGVEDVKILNGGIEAWKAAGYDLETESNEGTPAEDFGTEAPAHPEYWTSIDDAKDKLANDDNFKLVSIRSEPEWLGETSGYSYMDKAGEPEGAVWGKGAETAFDVAQFINEDGTVKDLDGILKVWEGCDFTLDNHLAFYCGTGWRATVPFLVLYENGYDNISIYDGGWYEWLMHDDYPVQVGDPASDSCQHVTVGELPADKAAKE